MKKFSVLLIAVSLLLLSGNGIAQTITSTKSGSWNDPLTWSGVVPIASNSTSIVINHSITIPAGYSVSIDQTTISAVGAIQIDPTGVVTIANGAGNDLTISSGSILNVFGTLAKSNGAVISGSTAATTTFQGGSIYQHQNTTTEGSIPLAVWNAASKLIVRGYTTLTIGTASGNWGQSFGNVEWNCAAQTATLTLQGLLTTIHGNLDILSTGTTGVLRLSTSGATNINVDGNFTVSGGSRIGFCTTGTCAINVTGDFAQNLTAGYVRLSDTGNGTGTLNLKGSANIQAGVFNGGATGRGNVNFVGPSGTSHTFNEAGIPTTNLINTLSYSVSSNNELNVLGESQLAGGTNSFFTLGTNAILRVESTDAAGAIQTGTAQGAATGNLRVTTSNRVYGAGSKIIYSGSGAQFMGNGQPAVGGITTVVNNNAGVTQVAASTLSLLGGVTLQTGDLTVNNSTLSIGGAIDLQAGDILFTSAATARTLTLNGNVTLGGNISATSGTQNANVVLGGSITGGGVISFTGANSNLTINGSGNMVLPLNGATSLETLTNNRTGAIAFTDALNINTNAATSLLSITAGNVTINGDLNGRDVTLTNGSSLIVSGNTTLTNSLTITNGNVQTDGTLSITNDLILTSGTMNANGSVTLTDDLTLGSGTTFFFEDQSVTLNSQLTNNGGVFSSNSSSVLNISNAGILGTLAFSPSGNTLGTFRLNRPTAGNLVTLNSALTVSNVFDLLDGVFVNTSGLNMSSTTVFTRNANASITGAIPTGGSYELILTGGTLTTGVEARGNLSDFTSNSSGTVTLVGAVLATGNLLINSGIFTCGANAVSVSNFTNGGTSFNAPSTTLTVAGDFVNNGTFNRNNGTVDFSNASTISGSSNPTFQNMVISGTLTSPTTLNITGNFINNGVFIPGSGTVVFTNTANGTKTIGGSQTIDFNNVNIQNNTANPDVSISGSVDLTGVLTLSTTAVLDADGAGSGVLTIVSSNDSPTSDGSVGILTGTSAITGNVTVERFMSIEGANGGRIYRYISAPVQNAPVSDIQNEIPVTGSFTGTSTCTGCSASQTMSEYNETVTTDSNGDLVINMNDGYVDFPSNSNTETFTPGKGYAMFVRGNLLSTARWNLRGPINQGNVAPISFTPTFTTSGSIANDGWNLLGNPFPSTINWNAASGWTKTNISGSFYVRDNATGQFATWNGSVGINGGSRYIPMGQAFWVQATGAPTLTANENVKAPGQQTTFFREKPLSDLLRITLVKDAVRDETVIHFRNEAKKEYDAETDARKFLNSTFSLSTLLSTGELLAINSKPFACSDPIKLNITNAAVGTYQLSFSEMETFDGKVNIVLTDHFLNNKTMDVTSVSAYSFDITANLASSGSNRFSLTFSSKVVLDELQFTTNPVCENENASISLLNSQADAYYFVTKDGILISDSLSGNDGAIQLSVEKENLIAGINNVKINTLSVGCLAPTQYEGSITVKEMSSLKVTSGKTCKEGAITLSVISSHENEGFTWYDDVEGDLVLSNSSQFTTPVISKTRRYYVSAINHFGCLSERKPVLAEVIQFEDVVVSENENGSLTSSYEEGNTWFFNGEEITGVTSKTIVPEKSGRYKVVSGIGGCSSSFEYEFVITDIEHQGFYSGISVYPNPVFDKVYIDVKENKTDIRKVMLYNNIGGVASETKWVSKNEGGGGIVEVGSLMPGVYIMRLLTSDGVVSLKIYKK